MTDVRKGRPAFESDLASDERLRASVQRLLREDYDPGRVIVETIGSGWPGDLAGRLLLSLSRAARAGLPTLVRARELNDAMLIAIGEQGYFGPRLDAIVDEQQVACHGWVVSGFLQYFYVTGDQRSRAAALRVVDQLIVPALDRLDSYPRERAGSVHAGGPSGTAMSVSGGWLVSSDAWCVLLVLNALVPCYLETGRSDLRAGIHQLAGELDGLDAISQGAQLHAVLAAARNLADYAEATGDAATRKVAIRVYDAYVRSARTLNHATFNWFGRPDSWTEPCAIVDSLGLAHTLGRITGDTRYRADALRITHNGLGFAERPDGSFGLDTIATPAFPVLREIEPDANWCCTMRGLIGLMEARENAIHYDSAKPELQIFDPYPGLVTLPGSGARWQLYESCQLDAALSVCVEVKEGPVAATELLIRVSFDDVEQIGRVGPKVGDMASMSIQLCDQEVATAPGEGLRFRGPFLMGLPEGGHTDTPDWLRVADGPLRGTDRPGSLRLIQPQARSDVPDPSDGEM